MFSNLDQSWKMITKAFSIALSSSKILALFPLYECKDVSQTTVSVSGSCGWEEDVLLVTVRVRKWENRKEVLRCCQSSDEFELNPGVGDGHRGLACCSPCGRKESDTTERLN